MLPTIKEIKMLSLIMSLLTTEETPRVYHLIRKCDFSVNYEYGWCHCDE